MSGKAPSRAPTESSASPWLDMGMGMAMVRWKGFRAQRTTRPRLVTRPRDDSFRRMCLARAELFTFFRADGSERMAGEGRSAEAAPSHLAGDGRGQEIAEPQIEHGADAHELVRPHLPLPVQDVPEPLAVDEGAPSELGHAHAALASRLLYPDRYQLRVLHRCLFPAVSKLRPTAMRPSGLSDITNLNLSTHSLLAKWLVLTWEDFSRFWEHIAERR